MIACSKKNNNNKISFMYFWKSKLRKYCLGTICIVCSLALIVSLSPDFGFAFNNIKNIYKSNKDYDSESVSTQICDDGIVLLKNDNYVNPSTGQKAPALPLSNNKINIFGVGGCDEGWYYQGNGSGAGSGAFRVPLNQAFRETGFEINEDLATEYKNLGVSNRVPVTEDPELNYTLNLTSNEFVSKQINSARQFSNQALVVFSRYGGEGNDLPKFQRKKITKDKDVSEIKWDSKKIYSELSEEEQQQLDIICSNFDNVCVLFNCCCPMQMGFLDNYKSIKSALYMPMGGNWGAYSVPKVLSGEVNPSGHLTDTIAYDFKTAPSYANMSYNYTGDDSFKKRYDDKRFLDHPNDYVHYTAYEENIYIGYYWYETADVDGFWARKGLNYNQVVQFPFGFGKSYTNFSWTDAKYTVEGGDISKLTGHETMNVSVKVTNTGSVEGKDVVQLYVRKPYIAGEIEKPAVQLVAFAKTSSLKPGESQIVKMSFNLQDIADYDCYDKNNDGHMGYELDNGIYDLFLRTDSHNNKDANLNSTFVLQYIVDYNTDKDTGNKIENLFTNYTNTKTKASSINSDKHPDNGRCASIDGSDFNAGSGIGATYLTRQNFDKTFPENFLKQMNIGTDWEKTHAVLFPWDDYKGPMPPQGQKVTKNLDDVMGKDYNDPVWDEVLNSLTYEEMFSLVQAKGGFGSPAISKIKKPATIDKDGPCGFAGGVNGSKIAAANYPSDSMIGSTWNYIMAHNFGNAIGYEAVNKLGGIDGNYGPGLDIHRSPLGGRNFEYYSEDPVLSGTLCSWQVSGGLDQGMYAYVKHVALNDSDTGRNGRYNFATEQTFRQIYAKAFEIIVKGAKVYNAEGNIIQSHQANAMMASVDRIGTTRVTGSYNFLTQMIRNEWGFKGSIVTDYYQSGDVNDVDEGIRVGNDLMLNGANNCEYDDTTSNTAKFFVRQAAKNILYTYTSTKNYQKTFKK